MGGHKQGIDVRGKENLLAGARPGSVYRNQDENHPMCKETVLNVPTTSISRLESNRYKVNIVRKSNWYNIPQVYRARTNSPPDLGDDCVDAIVIYIIGTNDLEPNRRVMLDIRQTLGKTNQSLMFYLPTTMIQGRTVIFARMPAWMLVLVMRFS